MVELWKGVSERRRSLGLWVGGGAFCPGFFLFSSFSASWPLGTEEAHPTPTPPAANCGHRDFLPEYHDSKEILPFELSLLFGYSDVKAMKILLREKVVINNQMFNSI